MHSEDYHITLQKQKRSPTDMLIFYTGQNVDTVSAFTLYTVVYSSFGNSIEKLETKKFSALASPRKIGVG